MKNQIDNTTMLGKLTQELRKEHKGFQEWDVSSNKRDHQAVVQVLHKFYVSSDFTHAHWHTHTHPYAPDHNHSVNFYHLQIMIDQRDPRSVDTEGKTLPALVYVAREKRPEFHHNFKAGAMNALVCNIFNIFYVCVCICTHIVTYTCKPDSCKWMDR